MKRFALVSAFLYLVSAAAIPRRCYAQLSAQQKADDLSTIVAAYDRYYAPLALASPGNSLNILNARPWIEQAEHTKSDAEFHQLCLRYLARFGNTQDTISMPQVFQATLGFTVDFYDGDVLIDSIDRNILPASGYPFQIGDQLLSVNGRHIDSWLEELIP